MGSAKAPVFGFPVYILQILMVTIIIIPPPGGGSNSRRLSEEEIYIFKQASKILNFVISKINDKF